MDVLFLDANVLYSAAYKESARVCRLWELPDVDLVTSAYAIEEARRNLDREEQRERLAELIRPIRIVPEVADIEKAVVHLPRGLCIPEDDLPILLAAIEARASHLLTGDFRHFGPLYRRRVRGVRILPPAA